MLYNNNVIFFTQERWTLQEDQQSFTYHCSKNDTKFIKDGTATISQRCPGYPRKSTPWHERLLMRRVEENWYASSLQLAKQVESQTGVTVSHDTMRHTMWRIAVRGCHPLRKPFLKPMYKKAPLGFASAHGEKDEDSIL